MNKIRSLLSIIIFCIILSIPFSVFSGESDISLTDKEIIERLTRLEEGQKNVKTSINDLKSELVNLKGEFKSDIDESRRELKGDIDELKIQQRISINDLRGLLYIVLAGIIALIGFVIWDRRSAISPVINKTREIDKKNDLTLTALKKFAIKEPRMGDVLKSLGLM